VKMARSHGVVLQVVYTGGQAVEVQLGEEEPGVTKRGKPKGKGVWEEDEPLTSLEGLLVANPVGLYSLERVREGMLEWEGRLLRLEGPARDSLQGDIGKVNQILGNGVAIDPGVCKGVGDGLACVRVRSL